MKKLIVLFMAALTGAALSAASGDSEANAVSIKVGGSQTVTLVEDADFADVKAGAYYLKTTLKKGTAYAIWIEGGDASKIGYRGISAYPYEGSDWGDDDWDDDWGDDWSFDDSDDDWGGGWSGGATKNPPTAAFTDSGVQGDRQAIWMAEDDWSSDDPSSWTYYIKLSGDIGQSTTVSISVSPHGARNRPEEIVMETGANSFSGYFVENGFFYFQSALAAGRKYFVRTSGAKTGRFDIQFVQTAGLRIEPDTGRASAGNAAYVLYPDVTSDFTFAVSNSAEEAGTQFGLDYEAYPARPIASHPCTNLFEGTWVKFKPGRVVEDPDFYDNIIDEQLFHMTAKAGERWVFDAKDADRPIEMRFYGPAGEILGKQASPANGTFDIRSGFDVPESGDYYIGVCDPALSPTDTVACAVTRLKAYRVEPADGEPVDVQPKAVTTNEIVDVTAVGAKSGPYALNDRCWSQNFLISGRKNLTYKFATKFRDGETPTNLTLKAELFKMSGTTAIRSSLLDGDDLTPGESVSFTANANATYLLRLSVAEGKALDFPAFDLYAIGYDLKKGSALATLTVNTYPGDFGGWKLDKESTKYTGEKVSILVSAGVEHKVKFSTVSDFTAPGELKFTISAGGVTNLTGRYYDRYDPEDDTADGARTMLLGASLSTRNRTLWADVYDGNKADPADWFAFAAADGVYYNFYLDKLSGDVRMTLYKPDATTPIFDGVTEISALQLDDYGGAGTYYICVRHGTETTNWVDSAYAFKASAADVGLVKFAKTSASAKKSAGTVKVTVNRTTDQGRIRVRYATKADTAVPGQDYVAQSGILEWADGEDDAKTIEIELLPDLVALKNASKTFKVVLTALDEAELQKGEYPAEIDPTAASCTVTLSSGGKYADLESAYSKSKVKKAATTKTEQVPLHTGTFYGVLGEDGTELTNGLPRLASVTVTAKDGGDVSASVVIGGKKYAFKGAGSWEDATNGFKRVTLPLAKGTGTMTVVLKGGQTDDPDAWMKAGGVVEIEMDVPDVKGKGSQAGIRYIGEVYRQNAKIQGYLNAVAKFYGYYTVALVPEGVTSLDGIPAGNGYLTVKVDNKGTAKVAGLLADGTKVSASVKAAAIVEDTNSVLGVSMILPVFQSKSPYCFGGTLRLFARPGKTTVDPNKVLDDEEKTPYQIVVDSSDTLTWNNDNAALTYDNVSGWRITCVPVGGWYDTVVNLEAYYIGYVLEVGTADITEFPSELVTSDGYHIVTTVQPNGLPFAFSGDKVVVPKKKLVKVEGGLYNLVESINPCDVKINFKRATGIVNGSFSVWSANDELGKQKVVKGFKHNGVLLLLRDDFALMGDNVASAGFFTQKMTINPEGARKSRKWTLSLPFNLLATDQGDIDWWADDAGWNPDWGEEPAEPGK